MWWTLAFMELGAMGDEEIMMTYRFDKKTVTRHLLDSTKYTKTYRLQS